MAGDRMKEPADLTLHELFEEQASSTPDAIALEDTRISLTYRELDGLADRLAAYLRTMGIGPDEPVGVYANRDHIDVGEPPPHGAAARLKD